MKAKNPDDNFATRDYVTAQVEAVKRHVEKVKSYIITHVATLLFTGVGIIVGSLVAFILYLHSDAKQERQANKSEAKQERQELKQQIRELKALIESLHGVNKGKPTASK